MFWVIALPVVGLILTALVACKYCWDTQDGLGAFLGLFIGGICSRLLLLVGGWVAALNGGAIPDYSEGERIGYVTKLSLRGAVYKTHEGSLQVGQGELVASQAPFEFSVSDPKVVEELKSAMNSGKKVKLRYREWLIQPYSKGGTDYDIVGVEILEAKKQVEEYPK